MKTALNVSELQNWFGKLQGGVQEIRKPLFSINELNNSLDTDTLSLMFHNDRRRTSIKLWLFQFFEKYFPFVNSYFVTSQQATVTIER